MGICSPISYFKGWRHSRGFGIHSPFAYRFITEVLAQRLPYYGYADISADSRIRLIFRVIAYFGPEHILILSSQPRLLKMAAHRAYSRAVITGNADSQPDFVIADAMDTTEDILMRPALADAMPRGMIFDNGKGTLVIIPAHGLPRQDFRVKF